MKLRILGNSLRLRLSQTEVDQIKNGDSVVEKIQFPSQVLSYQLSINKSESIATSFDGKHIVISIPESIARNWVGSNEVSIEGSSGSLKILIEKDFQCLTDRAEDESDLFPNPNTNC